MNKDSAVQTKTIARILKADSHSMSGSSIWASLECRCCFWIAGGLVSYFTMWLLTLQLFKNSIDTQEKFRLNLYSLSASVSELLEYGRMYVQTYSSERLMTSLWGHNILWWNQPIYQTQSKSKKTSAVIITTRKKEDRHRVVLNGDWCNVSCAGKRLFMMKGSNKAYQFTNKDLNISLKVFHKIRMFYSKI
jgi:hypothetical protein